MPNPNIRALFNHDHLPEWREGDEIGAGRLNRMQRAINRSSHQSGNFIPRIKLVRLTEDVDSETYDGEGIVQVWDTSAEEYVDSEETLVNIANPYQTDFTEDSLVVVWFHEQSAKNVIIHSDVECPDAPAVAAVAAGTTQLSATPISNGVIDVTAGDGTKGVRLPVPTAGNSVTVTVYNNSGSSLKVYPHSTGDINDGTTDASITMTTRKVATFMSVDGTTWVQQGG